MQTSNAAIGAFQAEPEEMSQAGGGDDNTTADAVLLAAAAPPLPSQLNDPGTTVVDRARPGNGRFRAYGQFGFGTVFGRLANARGDFIS